MPKLGNCKERRAKNEAERGSVKISHNLRNSLAGCLGALFREEIFLPFHLTSPAELATRNFLIAQRLAVIPQEMALKESGC